MAMQAAADWDGLGGKPGERFKNWTRDTWYQCLASLRRSCPDCLRRHGRVSPRPWGIPFHPHCECEQLEVPPGSLAPLPFADPSDVVGRLDASARADLVGADVERLLEAGLVRYGDLVDDDWKVATLDELVKRKALTLDQLVAAGIPDAAARRAVGLGPLGK